MREQTQNHRILEWYQRQYKITAITIKTKGIHLTTAVLVLTSILGNLDV